MGQVKVYATGNGCAAIVTPYSPAFVRRLKAIGGSAKNWKTFLSEPTTLVIHKVLRMAVQRMLNWDDSYGNFIILESDAVIAHRNLLEEKERLTKRLAEIDKLLEGGADE